MDPAATEEGFIFACNALPVNLGKMPNFYNTIQLPSAILVKYGIHSQITHSTCGD